MKFRQFILLNYLLLFDNMLYVNFINSELVKHLIFHGLLSDEQYVFFSSRSTANVDGYCWKSLSTLDKKGKAQAVALDISEVFDRVYLAGFLHKVEGLWCFFDLIQCFLWSIMKVDWMATPLDHFELMRASFFSWTHCSLFSLVTSLMSFLIQ